MFELLDQLSLLAAGRLCFFGPARAAPEYFKAVLGHGCPPGRSCADHLLHTVNADFGDVAETAHHIDQLAEAYWPSSHGSALAAQLDGAAAAKGEAFESPNAAPSGAVQTAVLVSRALTVNVRDLGIFWVRVVMYVALCVMMGFSAAKRRCPFARRAPPSHPATAVFFRRPKEWQDVFPRAALLCVPLA